MKYSNLIFLHFLLPDKLGLKLLGDPGGGDPFDILHFLLPDKLGLKHDVKKEDNPSIKPSFFTSR